MGTFIAHRAVLAFGIGHWELAIIGGVVILLFFGRRIPETMRSLGKGLTQFKKGMKEDAEDDAGSKDAQDAKHSKDDSQKGAGGGA